MSSIFGRLSESWTSPYVQVALICLTVVAIRAYLSRRRRDDDEEEETNEVLPPMEKRDFSLDELKPYNGVENPRILIAVNGKVFDVSRGRNNYGPGTNIHASYFAFYNRIYADKLDFC